MLDTEAVTQSSKECILRALLFGISSGPTVSRRGKANPTDVFVAITLPTSYHILRRDQDFPWGRPPWPGGVGLLA